MNEATDKNIEYELDGFAAVKDGKKKAERKPSCVIGAVNRFTSLLYRLFIGGIIGTVFTLYKKLQRHFTDGFICSLLGVGGPLSSYFAKLRFIISRSIEQSIILKFTNKKLNSLMRVNLSVYGLFFMIFGGLSAVLGIVDSGLSGVDILSSNDVWVGGILVVSSFSLMTSSKTLASAIRDGKLSRKIIDIFGISEEMLDNQEIAGRESVLIAIVFAVILGCIAYFVTPIFILLTILALIGVYLIIKHPEIGALCTLFFSPLSLLFQKGYEFIMALVCITLASYFIKVLCGRRRVKLELLSVLVLIFAVFLAFGGLFSAGGASSRFTAANMFCFVLSFIALINLLRSEAWIRRCMVALACSLVLISIMALLQLLTVKLGFFSALFGKDTVTYSAISSFFSNSETVSAYMVMLFPIFMFFVMKKGRILGRFGLLIGMSVALFAVVYVGSRPAWLGLVVGALLFMMLYSHKTLTAILIAALPTTCVCLFIPSEWMEKIFDYFRFSSESVFNRMEIWDGGLRMIRAYLFGGIGVGKEAFLEVYPIYATSGFEGVTDLHSVYLQLLAAIGVFGFSIFVILIIVYVQKCLCFMKQNTNKESRLPTLVCLCSTVSVLTMGAASDVFSDLGVFLVFFMVMALGCACVRIGDESFDRKRTIMDPNEKSAELIIDADKY